MNLETKLTKYAHLLAPNIWYSGKELSKIWNVNAQKRSGLIQHLVKRDMITRRGATTNITYKIRPESHWAQVLPKRVEKTGNGVIDAKLRKEAGLPTTLSSLEELITAATKMGTENESLKRALREINTTLDKIREYL
jgi:hypothetical protein